MSNEKKLTREEFIAKAKELSASGNKYATTSDSRRNRVCLIEEIDDGVIIHMSPVLNDMSSDEYWSFRKELDVVMPETDYEKGFYW